jgi:Zn/Cd-binding protein ZinT
MNQSTSSLSENMVIGNRFKTTHPDFLNSQITEVTYIGDHGTKDRHGNNGGHYLFEGVRPDGSKKAINFSKIKIASGRADQFFEYISSVSGSDA